MGDMENSEIYVRLMDISHKLGQQTAQLDEIAKRQNEDRAVGSAFRGEVRAKVEGIEDQMFEMQHTVKPIAESVAKHATTLELHAAELRDGKLFRDRWTAITGGIILVMTSVAGGVAYLFSAFFTEIKAWLLALFKS